jgi:hypothetical protein
MRKIHDDYDKIWEISPVWDLLSVEQKDYIEERSEIKKYRKNVEWRICESKLYDKRDR